MTESTNMMDIPSAVKEEVKYLLEHEGGDIVHIGQYQDYEVYRYFFPENVRTGYPIVVLYHQESATAYEVPAEDGLQIITEIYNKSEQS